MEKAQRLTVEDVYPDGGGGGGRGHARVGPCGAVVRVVDQQDGLGDGAAVRDHAHPAVAVVVVDHLRGIRRR